METNACASGAGDLRPINCHARHGASARLHISISFPRLAPEALPKTSANPAGRSFWLTATLLFGAFAASLAVAEGGALRDGTWNAASLRPSKLDSPLREGS